MAQKTDNRHPKRKEYIRLIIALGVLVIIAGSFALYLGWPLLTGTSIILATRPVDPFDPLRGQYMRINYEIGSIQNAAGFNVGDTIYVVVTPDAQGIYRYSSVSVVPPTEGIYLQGKVIHNYGGTVQVEYGIEQYFFERHASLPTRGITVRVKVDNMGKSRIVSLLQDGKPIKIQYEQ
jgi:uncharacterized membrane-anchored protein